MSLRWLLISVLLGGCGGPRNVSPVTVLKPTLLPSTRSPSNAQEYVPSDKSKRQSIGLSPASPNDEGGSLVGGLRVTDGGVRSTDITVPPLSSGIRLPQRLGAGFLFHNGTDLYFSTTMLGTLVPVYSAPNDAKITSISLGPSYVLLHLDSEARIAFSPKDRRRIAMPYPGLFDVAALDDGRAVTWLEGNRLLIRSAGSRSFTPVDAAELDIQDLRVVGSQIGLCIDEKFVSLDPSGKLIDSNRAWNEVVNAKTPLNPDWQGSASPRELAMQYGVPIGDSLALVPVGGGFAKVDLRNGKLAQRPRMVVADATECRLLPMESDILGICRTGNGGSVVIVRADSDAPSVERSFGDPGPYFAGERGTLIKEGSCSGPTRPEEFVICTRLRSGVWAELSMPRDIVDLNAPDAGTGRAEVTSPARWIPTADHGALGVVKGTTSYLIDVKKQITKALHDHNFEIYAGVSPSPSELLTTNFKVNPDGSIVGYMGDVPLRLTSEGKLNRGAHRFQNIESSGGSALAVDGSGHLWQSVDYGEHWVNVAPPPGKAQQLSVKHCSLAGCDMGDWFRIGYPASRTSDELYNVASPASTPVTDSASRLRCFSKGPASRRMVAIPTDREGNPIRTALFGASWAPLRSGDNAETPSFASEIGGNSLTRAGFLLDPRLNGDSPIELALAMMQPTRLRYHVPFSVPSIREASFTWSQVRSTLVQALGQNAPVDFSSGGQAVPVLSRVPGTTEGLLLTHGPAYIWLRTQGQPRFGAFPPELSQDNVLSAAIDGDGNLLLATRNDRTRIVKAEPKGVRTLFELPQIHPNSAPQPDALAIAADGTPAIIRMWSLESPTSDDPALVLTGGEPRALAPWSTLTTGNCADSDGYRAIVVAGAGWLRLNLGGPVQHSETPFFAMVHWNQKRVCLEAVEFPGENMMFDDSELRSSIVARLGAGAFASRYAFDFGVEYTEPFDCQFAPISQPPNGN